MELSDVSARDPKSSSPACMRSNHDWCARCFLGGASDDEDESFAVKSGAGGTTSLFSGIVLVVPLAGVDWLPVTVPGGLWSILGGLSMTGRGSSALGDPLRS